MRAWKWIAGIVAFLVVEFVIFALWLTTGLAENCEGRWQCSDELGEWLEVAVFLVPVVAALAALVAVKRRREARQRNDPGPLS